MLPEEEREVTPDIVGKPFNNPFEVYTFNKDEADVLVVNYESLYSRKEDRKQKVVIKEEIETFIKSCKDNNVAILVDESHKVKDIHSMQTMAINKIKNLCVVNSKKTYLYLLTGTPFTQGFLDTYSQLKLLGCPINKADFTEKFCVRGRIPGLLEWQQPIIGYKNVDLLYELIHSFSPFRPLKANFEFYHPLFFFLLFVFDYFQLFDYY